MKRYRVQVLRTKEIFYDREGGEIHNLAALAACCDDGDGNTSHIAESGSVRREEQSEILFEAAADTLDEIEMAVWGWIAAMGAELKELELAFPLPTSADDVPDVGNVVERFDAEAAMESHLDALNDPRDGWRLPR